MTPDEWGAKNREYPASAGFPGKRDPSLTPYTIEFGRAVASGLYPRAVLVMHSQGGKSEMLLDVIGERLDNAPCPILYVGPNKQFITEQWEPRIMALLDEAPSLARKVARGKGMTKTRKVIAGVPLRLAHGGSSTALKSDPAGLGIIDEADELLANVKGAGDPVSLVDRRGDTVADFVNAITSTPSEGVVQVERDEKSGLEFWAVSEADEIKSKIWQLWQSGTRHHWAWRCPQCEEYFIPRFACLEIPDVHRTTPARAKAEAYVVCPRNGCTIGDEHRAEMNRTGVFVAPGQWIEDGVVMGDPEPSETISFWVSGLASPFRSFGERAAAYIAALRSGDQEEVRAVKNGSFGELWTPTGGDIPEWEDLRRLRLPYAPMQLPVGVRYLTAGIDVQKNRLVYVVRGWGYSAESWLIEEGEIWGDTSHDDVWFQLSEVVIEREWDGMTLKRVFIDAGFRPGKRELVPEHKVYEFCRRNARICYASKGFDHRPTPVSVNRIDVNQRGTKAKYGLDLVRIDADFTKSWVHARLRWPEDQPGGWHLHQDVTDDYLRQIVSEARISKPGGGHVWIAKQRDNHYLDCEAMAFAAAFMLGILRLTAPRRGEPAPDASPPRKETIREALAKAAEQPIERPPPPPKPKPTGGPRKARAFRSSYM